MNELTPQKSLAFFEKNLPEFLSTDNEIKNLISDLRNSLKDERSADFHANVLESGKNFIKHIILRSIEYLSNEGNSPKDRSIENITKYIDAFSIFEEMVFGLDQNYRDHTLHSLWVYLFGHEFINGLGGYDKVEVAGQMDLTFTKEGQPKFVMGPKPIKGSKEHMETMWAMIAILHDLGYPVEAISSKPHEVFGRILDPFAIDLSAIFQVDLGSRISLLHQSVCDLLSTRYRPKGLNFEETQRLYEEADNKSIEGLLYVPREPTIAKDEAQEMEFRIASVDKIHSAWSAILAFKNIVYLHESDYHGGGNRDYLKLMTKRDILYSIVHHTSEEPKDLAINRFQFILLLIDDIEEAARYSRGGKERGIVSDYCDIKWEIDETKMTIELDYSNYDYKAQKKYDYVSKKYNFQISNKEIDPKYEIEMTFADSDFNKLLKLYLVKDKK